MSIQIDKGINLWYEDGTVTISLDETVMNQDLADLVTGFAKVKGKDVVIANCSLGIPPHMVRTSEFLTHPSFNSYHSESEMMRYLKSLENKDI
jgi:glycine dehydrogenase